MRVPLYIRKKMHRVAALHCAASQEMHDVETWFEKNGVDIDAFRDGCGCSLEELEYGNDVTEILCKRIETGVIFT
jgi:hypothetical protein